MKTVQEYEILDHGVEHSQYFQGCGTAFTEFDDVATGIGETPHEALADALESLAQNDWDMEGIENDLPDDVTYCEGCEYANEDGNCTGGDGECCEMHYFVSVRVR